MRRAPRRRRPGTLADYPVPGDDAHLLIQYAPGSRAYRFKLTTPETRHRQALTREPGTAPGILAGPDGPSYGRETPHGSPHRQPARQRARPRGPRAARPAGRGACRLSWPECQPGGASSVA